MVTRNYELMFIANPELDEESAEAPLQRIRGYLEETRGTIIKFDDWGMRRMAYAIQNHREGHYYLVHFTMDTDQVKEFERRLLLVEGVIREIIVRLDEEVVLPEAEVEAEVEPAAEEPSPTATETVEVETPAEAEVEPAAEEPSPTATEAVEGETPTEAEVEPAAEEPSPTAMEAVESGDIETPAAERTPAEV